MGGIVGVSLVTFLAFHVPGIGENKLGIRETRSFKSLVRRMPKYAGGLHNNAVWPSGSHPFGKFAQLRLRSTESCAFLLTRSRFEVIPLKTAGENLCVNIDANRRCKYCVHRSATLYFGASGDR